MKITIRKAFNNCVAAEPWNNACRKIDSGSCIPTSHLKAVFVFRKTILSILYGHYKNKIWIFRVHNSFRPSEWCWKFQSKNSILLIQNWIVEVVLRLPFKKVGKLSSQKSCNDVSTKLFIFSYWKGMIIKGKLKWWGNACCFILTTLKWIKVWTCWILKAQILYLRQIYQIFTRSMEWSMNKAKQIESYSSLNNTSRD